MPQGVFSGSLYQYVGITIIKPVSKTDRVLAGDASLF